MTKNRNFAKRRNWLRNIIIFTFLLSIALGIGVMSAYYYKTFEQNQLVNRELQDFKELISPPANDSFSELRNAMEKYNREIYESGQSNLVDAWSYQASVFDLSKYGLKNNAVGVVHIPDISVEMPLFLGASYDNLSKGFAQLSQTSMPIGGNNTNCVIAGHRGWKGMSYLRDIEQLEVGDSIYIQNLWDTLEYRISKIMLIHPNEIENIYIQKGKDLLTVITCHPYGVGSHRYVLICDRHTPKDAASNVIASSKSDKITVSKGLTFKSSQISIIYGTYLPWIFLTASGIILALSFLICHRRTKSKNDSATINHGP